MTPAGLARLKLDEGCLLKAYDDKTGRVLGPLPETGGIVTIGYGRNLISRGISNAESIYLLMNDVTEIETQFADLIPWYATVDGVRADIMVMVDYNTGNVFSFRRMLSAIKASDFVTAAAELLDSKAARETGERYNRMATAMTSGVWAVTA